MINKKIMIFILSLVIFTISFTKEDKISDFELNTIIEAENKDSIYFDITDENSEDINERSYDIISKEEIETLNKSFSKDLYIENDNYGIMASNVDILDSEYVISDKVFDFTNVNDTLSPYNRRMYALNGMLDKHVLAPTANVYKVIVPKFIRVGINNSENFAEIPTTVNSLLQLKFRKAANSLGRFVVNSTVGLAGTIDVAKHLGMNRDKETFGETLGHYGLDSGSYLVLPILGPSSVRDGAGMLVDNAMTNPVKGLVYDEFLYEPNILDEELTGAIEPIINGINKRSSIGFQYGQLNSPFEYDFVKILFTNFRKVEVVK